MMLTTILQSNPQLRGTLFDLEETLPPARRLIETRGLAERCDVLVGDFFKEVPADHDVYMLAHVLHDWTDEQALSILRNCRKVIPQNGRIVLVEFALPPNNEVGMGKDTDMVMLAVPGGMERTEEEYRELFEQSGFKMSKTTPTSSAVCVFEGRPSGPGSA